MPGVQEKDTHHKQAAAGQGALPCPLQSTMKGMKHMVKPNAEMQQFIDVLPGMQAEWDKLDDAGRKWMNEFMTLPTAERLEVVSRCALTAYGGKGPQN